MNTSGPSSSCRAYSPAPSRGRGTPAGRQQERIIPMEATTRAAIGGQCVGCSEPATATSFCCSKCKRNYRDSFNLLRVYNNETVVYDTDHINGFLRTVLGKNVRNKFYHCQRVDYNNGQYHSALLNPQAWQAFGLSWSDYVDKIVLPLASEGDRLMIATLKTIEAPKRETDLNKYISRGTVSHRIYYLLFNILWNCVQLNVAFPNHLCIVPNGSFISQSYKQQRQDTVVGSLLSPVHVQSKRNSVRSKRKFSTTTPVQDKLNKERAERQSQKRRKRLLYDARVAQENEYLNNYLQWEADLKVEYKRTRRYIDKYTKQWNPNWEKLVNTPGLGCSGTLSIESAFLLHKHFQAIAIANDAVNIIVGDAGASCMDQMRNNRITFPKASCYGFEMQNLKQYGMSSGEQCNKAWAEFDKLLSIANKDSISTSPVDCAFNVMVTRDSSALSYPKFLSACCKSGSKCTKDENLYRQSRTAEAHYCSTCGFSEPEHKSFTSPGSLHFLSYFAKTWTEEDKDVLFKMIGPMSSTVDVIFIGDEKENHNSGFVLQSLNNNIQSHANRWHLARHNFKVVLKGGGTTFEGFIYARNSVKTDYKTVHRKIYLRQPKRQYTFHNSPDYKQSGLLDIFTKLDLKHVSLARRSVQWIMSQRGFWEHVSLPDPASAANWVYRQSEQLGITEIEVMRDVIKEHCGSFRESWSYREPGVHNRGFYSSTKRIDIEQICDDLGKLMKYVEDKETIYHSDQMFCLNCAMQGDTPLVCGHIDFVSSGCQWRHLRFMKKSSVSEMQKEYEAKILAYANKEATRNEKYVALAEGFKERVSSGQRLGPNRGVFVKHEKFISRLDIANLTEMDKIRLVVLKTIEIFTNDYTNMTDEDAEREYIHRMKYNLTKANFQLYQRWNRAYRSQRTVKNHWTFELEGEEYSVPIPTIATEDDADKRIRLLQKAYADGMPKATVINCGDGVDAVIADSFERVCRYRLQTVLRNKIKRARYNSHKFTLIIGKKFDGAPFNKSGAETSQTVVLAHITNEHFSVTIETLLLCGIINSEEDSDYTKQMCKQLDASMAAFQKMVAERSLTDDPYRVEGERINSVEILLTMDLKAANKVLGAGPHSCTYWGITHAGVSSASSGFGMRHRSEENLFSKYRRPFQNDANIWSTTEYITKNGTRQENTSVPWQSKNDLPIFINHHDRKTLRQEIEVLMKDGGHGFSTDRRYRRCGRSKWEKIALGAAKKRGHSFVYEEYFPLTIFASICYCSLHFKTVKALDLLYLMMLSMTTFDRYSGHIEAVGPALDHFLEALTEPEFKSQLTSFVRDARAMWLSLKVKKGLCHTGNGNTLHALLEKDAKVSIRLLGRQANVVFNNLHKIEDILRQSLSKSAYNKKIARRVNHKKTKASLDEEMEVVISSIMSYSIACRNMIYWASRSGLAAYENGGSHVDYADYVKNAAAEMCEAAAILEMIQSCVFPNLKRPYDISITFCLQDITQFLLNYELLQGYEGLLEQSEKYHSWIGNMPAFKLSKGYRNQESRNVYKFGRAWLVNCYFYTQPYGIHKGTRKKKASCKSDIIPPEIYPYFHSAVKCPCGAAENAEQCEWCSKGRKTEIFLLAKNCVSLVGTPLSASTRELWEHWKKIRSMQFIKGLKVKYIV